MSLMTSPKIVTQRDYVFDAAEQMAANLLYILVNVFVEPPYVGSI